MKHPETFVCNNVRTARRCRVAEHRAEHEILLGGEFVERLVDECRHGLQTHAVAEVKIHLAVGHRLNPVSDTQSFQPLGEQRSAGAAHRAEHQTPYTFLELVNLVQEQLHRIVTAELLGAHRYSFLICSHHAATRRSVLSGALSSTASPTNFPPRQTSEPVSSYPSGA